MYVDFLRISGAYHAEPMAGMTIRHTCHRSIKGI